jgi:hypothetical protein
LKNQPRILASAIVAPIIAGAGQRNSVIPFSAKISLIVNGAGYLLLEVMSEPNVSYKIRQAA